MIASATIISGAASPTTTHSNTQIQDDPHRRFAQLVRCSTTPPSDAPPRNAPASSKVRPALIATPSSSDSTLPRPIHRPAHRFGEACETKASALPTSHPLPRPKTRCHSPHAGSPHRPVNASGAKKTRWRHHPYHHANCDRNLAHPHPRRTLRRDSRRDHRPRRYWARSPWRHHCRW